MEYSDSISSLFTYGDGGSEESPLCFDPQIFKDESFDCQKFIDSQLKGSSDATLSLQALLEDQNRFIKHQRFRQADLLNTHYSHFLGISSKLQRVIGHTETMLGCVKRLQDRTNQARSVITSRLRSATQTELQQQKHATIIHVLQDSMRVQDDVCNMSSILSSVKDDVKRLFSREAGHHAFLRASVLEACASQVLHTLLLLKTVLVELKHQVGYFPDYSEILVKCCSFEELLKIVLVHIFEQGICTGNRVVCEQCSVGLSIYTDTEEPMFLLASLLLESSLTIALTSVSSTAISTCTSLQEPYTNVCSIVSLVLQYIEANVPHSTTFATKLSTVCIIYTMSKLKELTSLVKAQDIWSYRGITSTKIIVYLQQYQLIHTQYQKYTSFFSEEVLAQVLPSGDLVLNQNEDIQVYLVTCLKHCTSSCELVHTNAKKEDVFLTHLSKLIHIVQNIMNNLYDETHYIIPFHLTITNEHIYIMQLITQLQTSMIQHISICSTTCTCYTRYITISHTLSQLTVQHETYMLENYNLQMHMAQLLSMDMHQFVHSEVTTLTSQEACKKHALVYTQYPITHLQADLLTIYNTLDTTRQTMKTVTNTIYTNLYTKMQQVVISQFEKDNLLEQIKQVKNIYFLTSRSTPTVSSVTITPVIDYIKATIQNSKFETILYQVLLTITQQLCIIYTQAVGQLVQQFLDMSKSIHADEKEDIQKMQQQMQLDIKSITSIIAEYQGNADQNTAQEELQALPSLFNKLL